MKHLGWFSTLPLSVVLISSCGLPPFANDDDSSGGGPPSLAEIAADPVCSRSDIDSVEVPINWSDKSSEKMTWKFRHVAAESGKPTIIFLAGGPGQGAIGMSVEGSFKLPSSWGKVFVDPRGVRCNAREIPKKDWRTDFIARDIIASVKHLKLDNYMIYGVSYGTQLGTVLANLIEKDSTLAPPKALVLEGVLGRAFTTYDEQIGEFERQWQRHLNSASNSVQNAFSSDDTLPLGLRAEEWGAFIIAGLYQGAAPTTDEDTGETTSFDLINDVLFMIALDDAQINAKIRSAIKEMVNTPDESSAQDFETMFVMVSCREITREGSGMGFIDGHIISIPSDYCTQADVTWKPYDVKDYPVTVPSYYFVGEHDPATPQFQAEYHRDNTPAAVKEYTLVPDAGHNPLINNLDDCSNWIWKQIADGAAVTATIADHCDWYGLANGGAPLLGVVDSLPLTKLKMLR